MLKNLTFACALCLAAAAVRAQGVPAQPPPVCTRADLKAAVDGYVAAQKAGDVSKLALADKAVFKENCATCHKLYGEGGDTGPELTGYERTNLEFMLPSIVDPSAAIREEFTNFAVFTADGRTLTGLIQDQNNRTVTLRSVDNQTTLVNRDDIEDLKALPVSLMPDGLLAKLSDEQVRDLFAYLMSRAPDQK